MKIFLDDYRPYSVVIQKLLPINCYQTALMTLKFFSCKISYNHSSSATKCNEFKKSACVYVQMYQTQCMISIAAMISQLIDESINRLVHLQKSNQLFTSSSLLNTMIYLSYLTNFDSYDGTLKIFFVLFSSSCKKCTSFWPVIF